MPVINGFITVDTENTKGTLLTTNCGELKTHKKGMSFTIDNNFTNKIYCTTIINGKMNRVDIEPGQGHPIVFEDITEIRIYFGDPSEGAKYSYTSIWGDNFGGNPHVLGLFYMVKSNYINVNSLVPIP
jgi:hypothetical protein